MKFSIEYRQDIDQISKLVYYKEEWSFDTIPHVKGINFELSLNWLTLACTQDNNSLTQISGFCGLNKSCKSHYNEPISKKGVLRVLDDLKGGTGSYRIYNHSVPVYVNVETGWICLGYPEKVGNGVEFINNCIAVISDEGNFLALWLKPNILPDL